MATLLDLLRPRSQSDLSAFDMLPQHVQAGENALLASAFRNRDQPIANSPIHDPQVTNRASMLPLGNYDDGSIGLAWPQMALDAANAFTLPGRVYQGKVADADLPAETLNMGLNLAGIGGGKAVAKGLMRGASDAPELGMFGGRLAKTADHAALAKAEAADAAGVPREDIWKQHGWFKGVDGKWRFEIYDSGLSAFLGSGRGIESGSVQHPQLAEAYNMDGLRTDISNGPQRGSFSPWTEREVKSGWPFQRTKTEVVNPGDLIASGPSEGIRKSVVGHELQHAVQFKEKFAGGGSPKAFGSDEMLYKRLAGETEARAVQSRMNLTPAKRQALPPWKSYDVPEDQQIVRFGDNGPAASMGSDPLPMDYESRMARAKAMGFDPHDEWHHYSPSASEISNFDTNRIGDNYGVPHGIHFTDEHSVGQNYGDKFLSAVLPNSDQMVNLDLTDYEDALPMFRTLTGRRKLSGYDIDGHSANSFFDEYAGALENNLPKDKHGYIISDKNSRQAVVFDPRKARSIDAAFDPVKSDSADLLSMNPPGLPISAILPQQKRKR